MSLVYRAVWEDRAHVPTSVLDDAYRQWCGSKGIDPIDLGYRGRSVLEQGVSDIRRADTEAGSVLRTSLIENDGRRTWTATATAIVSTTFKGYWVDVDCHDPDGGRWIPIAAPRLVRLLLAEPGEPHRGPVPIADRATVLRPGDHVDRLHELLFDPTRDLPVVVVSPDEFGMPQSTIDRAHAAAEALAGLAQVVMLTPGAVEPFNAELADGFGVYGGAVRAYLPGLADDDDQFRHRYWGLRSFNRYARRAGLLVASHLARVQEWPDPPEEWGGLRMLVMRPTDDEFASLRRDAIAAAPANAVDEADTDADAAPTAVERELADQVAALNVQVAEMARDVDRHRTRASDAETELLNSAALIDEYTNEVAALRENLRVVTNTVRGVLEESRPARDEIALDLPSEVQEFAAEYLTMVVFPPGAAEHAEELDESVNARTWARLTWQGLCALEEYALEVGAGTATAGFYEWCRATSRWPTTKLTMRESKSVRNNESWRTCRALPVSTDVRDDGMILMEAHLQVVPGGGANIPRLYFHDDTKGVTGKVHVGFYGPHSYMPNTKTN